MIVVLVAINRMRHAILLAVDFRLLCRSQLATIVFTHIVHFVVDGSVLLFQPGGLGGGQRTVLDALAHTILLVFQPLAGFALWVGVLLLGIVFLLLDFFRQSVRLAGLL